MFDAEAAGRRVVAALARRDMRASAVVSADDAAFALRLAGVRKSYRRHLWSRPHEALRGVDLELARGRVLGLAGPNGSGKSTVLRLVAGLEGADAGVVRVLGADPRADGVQRRVGYLPDDSPFPAELDARSALELLAALHDLPRAGLRERGDALLDLVGLAARARTPLSAYSRGMLRRFGLAQAWLCEPELVLLDEPTAGLDAPGYAALARLFDSARARGTTVVLASHLSDDFREHADELAIVLDGRIALRGPCAELLRENGLQDLYRRSAESSS